ncbi:hypothetical protein TNCV_17051 [Trichonephila clavipes]|nr:hypothetical protein TNCV_17051 [Trichonephila clavipes]
MPSPEFEPRLYGAEVSVANHSIGGVAVKESVENWKIVSSLKKSAKSLFLLLTLLSCTMAILSIHLGHSHHHVPSYGHGYGYGHHYYPSHGYGHGYGHGHHSYGHHHPALTIGFGRR